MNLKKTGIPNLVTAARIALIPVFMVCMEFYWPITAMTLFIVISLTDALDGYLARRMNQVTDLGKILDPLADKLLVTVAVLYLTADAQIEVWVAIIIIAREFVVSSLRVVAASKGLVIAAGWSGKIKTTVQLVAITFMLSPWGYAPIFSTDFYWAGPLGWLMALAALWSGADYLWKHRGIVKQNEKEI